MSSVGSHLKELRQRKGVPLEEIARTTRVAYHYLESLEADAFDALPSAVFTRGFIRAYCQAVGESPDQALAAYDSREADAPTVTTAARPVTTAARAASTPRTTGAPTPRRAADKEARGRGAVLVSFVLLVVLGVALFAVALLIHPRERAERVAATSRPEPRAESRPVRAPDDTAAATSAAPAPSTAPPVTPSPPRPALSPATGSGAPALTPAMPSTPSAPLTSGPRPTPPAATRTPAAPITPPSAAAPGEPASAAARPAPAAPSAPPAATVDAVVGGVASPYRLVARTSETTWIRVRTEDGRTSEENVPPGEVREWVSNRPFVLSVGNAGGVSLELNGRALPPLGPNGVVIQRIVLPPEPR